MLTPIAPGPLPGDVSLEALLRTVLTIAQTGVMLLRPVYAEAGSPAPLVDFTWEQLNPAAQQMLRLPERPVESFLTLFPTAQAAGVFGFYRDAFLSGQVERRDNLYQFDGLDGYYRLVAQRQGPVLVVSFTDTNEESRSAVEQALRESQAREAVAYAEAERQRGELARFFDQAPVAMALFRGAEYVIELANEPMATVWNRPLAQVLGQPVFEALPYVRNQGFEAIFADVLARGTSVDLREVPVTIDRAHTGQPTRGYFDLTYRPQRDAQGRVTGIITSAYEVTAQVLARQQVEQLNQQLQKSRDLLHAIAETQTTHVSAFKALRDEHGCLVDLEFLFANSATTSLVGGHSLVGQRYLALFPQLVELGLWEFFSRVVETGETAEREQVNEAGPVGWFHITACRLGDGLLVCSADITARKQAEQARAQTLHLLEQSEEVARMGSWDYDLAAQTLTWSGGMYRLLGVPPGSAVSLPGYLDVVVAEDRAVAEQLVRNLQAGTGSLEAVLRLRVADTVKTVRVKAALLPGEAGRPGRVLGVDLDVSDVQRLEAENLALRLDQQQALLLAILQAQETERSRLAESLHNGLGQLLYAIKLQISQLDLPALHALPALDGVRAHADRLLADAIQQTRTLSHELMPTRLLERGLAAALRDICRDLTTPGLHFACHIWLHEPVLLPSPLQTALYRLAQELAHNVAKHAQASQAALEFELLPGWAMLRAEDNGRGFDPAGTAHGLGLRLLHETVDLLGGTIALDSSPEYGTHIRLRIPIPPANAL